MKPKTILREIFGKLIFSGTLCRLIFHLLLGCKLYLEWVHTPPNSGCGVSRHGVQGKISSPIITSILIFFFTWLHIVRKYNIIQLLSYLNYFYLAKGDLNGRIHLSSPLGNKEISSQILLQNINLFTDQYKLQAILHLFWVKIKLPLR